MPPAGSVPIVALRGVAATCLFTLRARADESERRDALFRDPLAVAILERLDWDSSPYDRDWMAQTGIAIRTEILDEATRGFLALHPHATVVNLGAGLCTRFYRVDDATVEWVDVDLPEVIDLRRSALPAHDRCRAIASSVWRFEWMDTLDGRVARPLLFICEGLLQYFPRAEVDALLGVIARRFPGAEMLLETVSPAARMLARWQPSLVAAGVRVRWSLRDAAELERWSERIEVVGEWHYDRHPERWRWLRALGWLRWVRRLMKIVHVRFRTEPNPMRSGPPAPSEANARPR